MFTIRFSRISISFLVGCLVFLFAASAAPYHANANSSSTSHALRPAISTSCPASGTANAAYMPSMTLGTHPTIVYIVNDPTVSPPAGTLKRYDIVTGVKVEIVKLANNTITEAQVSANGQWLLFVANVLGLNKLQLVRMDGQDLQTLYCSSTGIDRVQWSTDQKHIVFEEFTSTSELIKLITTSTGAVQTLLTRPSSNVVIVRTWLDLHRIYLTNTQIDAPPNTIYLLDINNPGTLIKVFNGSFSDFDSSFDATKLFISNCVCGRGNSGPGTITVQPATGGQQQTIYSNANDAINSVRAVLPTTLLFTVNNFMLGGGGNFPDNGLWKINTNGTGVKHLTTEQTSQSTLLNQFTQFPWSNVSRDGTKYVLQIISSSSSSITYTLEFGSLSGGSPFVFASITTVQLETVGWTTM